MQRPPRRAANQRIPRYERVDYVSANMWVCCKKKCCPLSKRAALKISMLWPGSGDSGPGRDRRLGRRRDHASISGDDRGERVEPVELVVDASPGNVDLGLLIDIDTDNTEQVLVEDVVRPEIDVEIFGLHS